MSLEKYMSEAESKMLKDEAKFDAVVEYKDMDTFIKHKTENSEIKNVSRMLKIGYVENNVWHRYNVKDIIEREDFADFMMEGSFSIKNTDIDASNFEELANAYTPSLFSTIGRKEEKPHPSLSFITKIKKSDLANNEKIIRDQILSQEKMENAMTTISDSIRWLERMKSYINMFYSEKVYFDVPIEKDIDMKKVKEFVNMCQAIETSANREDTLKEIEKMKKDGEI